MPDFSRRSTALEQMDDLSIVDDRLSRALDDLRLVNRFLGGTALSQKRLLDALDVTGGAAVLHPERPLRILDVGCGGGDLAAALVRWGARAHRQVEVVGVDLNPATLNHARRWLDRKLPEDLAARVTLREADAFALPFPDDAFDAAHASLFLHHFPHADVAHLMAEMARVARVVVVNDLHRHPAAYHAIRVLARMSPSEMFRHDAPLSVLRGFSRAELRRAARDAGLVHDLAWRWAFRWVLVARKPASR
ncbi:MAG: methyltransferase domain-containing protein [Rhodothermales bacterium]|nr:methyltransferase domain-containing protein [Rhodothermales bacterium]MCA0267625.1 methyltransferase domain-containing protein [Bacteroidota bacterium]